MPLTRKLFAAIAALMFASTAFADDAPLDKASLEYGNGIKVQMVRIGVQKDWNTEWFNSNGTHLTGYWDFELQEWRGRSYRNVPGAIENITVISASPLFRYENVNHKGWYFEGGIGPTLTSKLYNNDGSRLSTAFQFSDQIGTGYVFDNRWEVAMKINHFSNGGFKHPNTGVNFLVVKVAMPF